MKHENEVCGAGGEWPSRAEVFGLRQERADWRRCAYFAECAPPSGECVGFRVLLYNGL